jgi:hypothetical protein
MTRRAAAIGSVLATLAGCSSEAPRQEPASPAPDRADDSARARPADRSRALVPARCPRSLTNCSTASGRIVYVERVDPDGDGDAHFVLASREAITLPGLSVIDVKRSLRPHPLPGPGDRISAAGPVYRGSYGQKQIEAIELHVARAR